MKNRQDFYRSHYDQAFFAQTILGLDLYPYQIDILRSTQIKLNPADMTDICGMLPSGAGLTTITAIIGAHNMIFNSDNMRTFVVGTDEKVKDLHDRVFEHIATAEKYFDSKFTPTIDEPTRTVNKDGATNLYYTPAKNIFRDLPITDLFVDTAITRTVNNPWFEDAMESIKPQAGRVFAFSTSFNPLIQIIINTLKRAKRTVREVKADARTIFGPDAYDTKLKELGQENFLNDVVCGDVADPNAMARFYRGE